jgi:hypothetical protein
VELGANPVNVQLIDVLSPAREPPALLFQAINVDLSGSGVGMKGKRSTGRIVPVIEKLTPGV